MHGKRTRRHRPRGLPGSPACCHHCAGASPLHDDAVKAAIVAEEAALGARGRVLIRASGTEPVIRVMAEAEEEALVEATVARLAETIRAKARAA